MTGHETLWWDRSLFVRHDTSDEPCPEEVDITGPVRVIVFGPMIVMPAGRIRMTIDFHLCADAVKVPYNYQLLFGRTLVERPFSPMAAGRYKISLEAESADDAHVAMRLWTSRAAFDGRLRFFGAEVVRL